MLAISGWWTVRLIALRWGKSELWSEWGTCFITVVSQSLATDTRSFSRQSLQWPTTSVLFLCCLTASSSQIVILRFCCAKILGYKAHPNFSTNLPSEDRFFLKKPCALLPKNYGMSLVTIWWPIQMIIITLYLESLTVTLHWCKPSRTIHCNYYIYPSLSSMY